MNDQIEALKAAAQSGVDIGKLADRMTQAELMAAMNFMLSQLTEEQRREFFERADREERDGLYG
jgi:hypothetical protein